MQNGFYIKQFRISRLVKLSFLFIIGQFVDILGGMLGGVVGSSALRDFRATEAVCETLTAIGSMKQVLVPPSLS
jgi:hypothetical protein